MIIPVHTSICPSRNTVLIEREHGAARGYRQEMKVGVEGVLAWDGGLHKGLRGREQLDRVQIKKFGHMLINREEG